MNSEPRGFSAFIRSRRPATLVVLGYALYIASGFVMLCLPFAQAGHGVSWLDNLFTATSAVSTTGLATVSPGTRYSLFGELVIAGLIQVGGIGYMTLGSFVMLALRHRLDDMHRGVARTAFVLPERMNLARFIRNVVGFTLVIEVVGAAALALLFARAGAPEPIWNGIFHSISAFCTAGFSLFDNSLEDYRANTGINMVVAALSYLGAIGFIVMSDWWRWLTTRQRRSLTSRIILRVTFWLALIGTVVIALTDTGLAKLGLEERLLASFFQTMTAMTTVGFDTYPIAGMSSASILLLIVAMVMGASPSGTGGGLKSTTIAIFYGAVRSTLAGRARIGLLGRDIGAARIQMAMAATGMYVGTLVIGVTTLMLVERQGFLPLLFESASAIGTVGLSLGATGALTSVGKLVVIAMMFVGRLGPITLGMALFPPPSRRQAMAGHVEDLAV
ncbi:TrkH family potassium uptake protein [Salinisphaera aquimarina]|uniref:TrkH family potassium uptake protein n=1 Tax=Salinisphaera aquimarina TaxID=2094031 RepID=A0ABV7EU32_9GAMM